MPRDFKGLPGMDAGAPAGLGWACQFIAGSAGGDAGKCGLPVVGHSAYCERHRRQCVRAPMPYTALLRLAGIRNCR